MKCKFCGKRIKKNSNMCEYCGKEINEGMNTEELIDAMPEIRDEFDKISELQEKEKKKEEKKEKRAQGRKKRIIAAVLIIAAILACVVGGIYYYNDKAGAGQPQEPVLTTTAIDSQFQKSFAGEGFTNLAILDAASAKEAINGAKATFNIQDVEKEYELEKEFSIGDSKIYRFRQMYEGIPVFGGEIAIMADSAGSAKAINIAYVETKGLTTSYAIDEGKASAAITEYVNVMADDYSVVNGVKISPISKAVCNTDGKAYLAYCANVSGYNRNGEYIAYNVFVDGISGNGICSVVTSSYETETAETVTEEEIEDSYIYKMITVNDKFKWNDDAVDTAKEDIKISDVTDGNASEYVMSIKKAVDDAYAYFDNTFGWKGLNGTGEEFKVYINPNEYVEENLPAEKAMYTNGSLMFFREDLAQGEIDYNTVVHEYAHGVIENIAAMCGTKQINENAAIAEGLADVFAELAEAKLTGENPDWIHGVRNLKVPDMGYHISTATAPQIISIQECYEYSTIVSHMAAYMSSYIDIDTQNEIWFKTMCLMTRHTDFAEFAQILDAVVNDMYAYTKIDMEQYSSIKTGIEMLSASEQDFYAMEHDEAEPELPSGEATAETETTEE